jgi:hypothetical protein
LTELPVGAQIVVGINPGPALEVRDGQGITRYQRIQQMLSVWSQSLKPEAGDDLSLVTFAGPIIAHTNPASWLESFTAFQPDFRSTTPNIQALALAVDAASAPTPQVGMKRTVLFITPHMDDPNLEAALANIGQRAVAGRVRIFIWLVDSDLYFTHSSAALFNTIATQTGGAFITFNGLGGLPNPEIYFAPLRSAYRITYTSGLTSTGDHTLSADVNLGGTRVTSAAQTLTLDIRPPNPIISAPPAQVTRTAPPDDPFNTKVLVPTEQKLEVIFDFPDGHKRPIVSVTLYVDGQAVAKNTTGALDQFTWDLSAYTESGPHILKVEATDSLGLTGASLDTPVDIQVVKPANNLSTLFARYRLVIVGVVVGLAGLVLLGILLTGRLRLRSRSARRAARQQHLDPLTQPVTIASSEPPTGPKKTRRTRPAKIPDAPATLIRLAPDGQPAPDSPIPVTGPELTLGTDPVQAAYILDELVISPLHARIQQKESDFTIYDQGSVAGTWVNYESVTREGYPLKHGDRVHLGHLMYRFEL